MAKARPYRDKRGRFAKRRKRVTQPLTKGKKRPSLPSVKKPSLSTSNKKPKSSTPKAPVARYTTGAYFIGRRDQLGTGVFFNWWRVRVRSEFERRKKDKGKREKLWFVSASDIAYACDAETRSKTRGKKVEVLVRGYANILFRDKGEQWTVCSPTLFAGDKTTPEELADEIANFINKYQVQSVIEVNLAFEPIGRKDVRYHKQNKTIKKRVKKVRGGGHRKLAGRKGVARRHKLAKRR
jgi:hypothetical protein